jgi:hypothetical protein
MTALPQSDFFEKLLASKKAEALSWLRSSSTECMRTFGEMDTVKSVAFVESLYALGAIKVWAVKINDEYWVENTGLLVVELPLDIQQRLALFEFEARHAESHGFSGEADIDQPYLSFKID